jgi:hypothetical protein
VAVSGTISATAFNTNRVVDQAFRRLRLSAQAITPEMQEYAKDALYLFLSQLANDKAPSWCIEKQLYPFYTGQPLVTLDVGTVDVLNANLRVTQEAIGVVTDTPTSYSVNFTGQISASPQVSTVGIKWSGASVPVTFETSPDGATWTQVGASSVAAVAGQWTWVDILPARFAAYFRVLSVAPRLSSRVYLGTLPQEIPMGILNRDDYVAQSNKVFQGRPLSMWFQRNQLNPVINVWPAPNDAAEFMQLVVWRHRHIMDVGTLTQDIEVPQRWMEAIISGLAAALLYQTPSADMALMQPLEAKAAFALQNARSGDNDGSPMRVQPTISVYTA